RQSVYRAGGTVGDGVLRPVLPMRFDPRGHTPRDEQLALAGVHLRVHDRPGVSGGFAGVSGRHLDLVRGVSNLLMEGARWTGKRRSGWRWWREPWATWAGRPGAPGGGGSAAAGAEAAAGGVAGRPVRGIMRQIGEARKYLSQKRI